MQLTALPVDLCRLPRLASLRIRGNRIKFLPDALGCMSVLRNLDVSTNQLEVMLYLSLRTTVIG